MMFFYKACLISALSLRIISSAAPAELSTKNMNKELDTGLTVCSGTLHPATGCVNFFFNGESCVNFTGGLAFLYKQVSSASVGPNIICTFYKSLGCNPSGSDSDMAVLSSGEYGFSSVPGLNGTIDFDNMASSYSCSAF
ncbi:hypothetical protein BDQ12DRAFT_685476 [Crucibulum laeve]|uniref:Beta/gamma crystallin 'Greek key' domain-containing protein n=1 Tax=Crucibulum laeve TaxID=68775 RepID=A0A5C3LXB8_9AGAR|nr:hypothetical protein BDQ12DRAFT_685476 [Crucibulum laeve]